MAQVNLPPTATSTTGAPTSIRVGTSPTIHSQYLIGTSRLAQHHSSPATIAQTSPFASKVVTPDGSPAIGVGVSTSSPAPGICPTELSPQQTRFVEESIPQIG